MSTNKPMEELMERMTRLEQIIGDLHESVCRKAEPDNQKHNELVAIYTEEVAKQRHEESIIKSFDFEKVRDIMLATDWRWSGDKGAYVPTISELKTSAREQLARVAKNGGWVSSGGFSAMCRNFEEDGKNYFQMSLFFGIDSMCDYDEDRDDVEELGNWVEFVRD
jgi:hypothetical protein